MELYRTVLRAALFRIDPETVHCALHAAQLARASQQLCSAIAARHRPFRDRLSIEVAGIRFSSPPGLAAGFDKSARAVPILGALDFGHVEIGSVSAEVSAGNPKPCLFRIPAADGIVVNDGLPNDGADRAAERLAGLHLSTPSGINVVSTNKGAAAAIEPEEAAVADHLSSFARLQRFADYPRLNLSCPNTREGRSSFHEPRRPRLLLDSLAEAGVAKPVFLKVAPFATEGAMEAFPAAVEPAQFVNGFSVNLPSGKPPGLETPAAQLAHMPGAVSGRPSAPAADATITALYRRMDRRRYCIIGSGAVFTAEDAFRKIRLGASLVQLMTAQIDRGLGILARINQELARLVEASGFDHSEQAVGIDAGSA